MTEFFTAGELASYPGVALTEEQIPELVVTLINELVDEVVVDVIGNTTLDPVPAKIRAIALAAAARSVDPARMRGAESYTEGIDDWKATIRFRLADGEEVETGIYLTDKEEAAIRAVLRDEPSKPVGSIRLHVPGYGRGSRTW